MKKENSMKKICTLLTLLFILSSCATDNPTEEGWSSLFDGKTTNGWRNFNSKGILPGWQVVDGTLHHSKKGGNIITEKQYSDFELKLQWKISEGGNSGIFLRVTEDHKQPWATGIERCLCRNAARRTARNRCSIFSRCTQ